jgi:hypothetical protein
VIVNVWCVLEAAIVCSPRPGAHCDCAQISIDEGEHDGAWGLCLALDVRSRLGSACVDKSIDAATSEPETRLTHMIAATMRHLVFVSKRDYDKTDGGLVVSSCLLELSLIACDTGAAVEETDSETPVSEDQQKTGATSASPTSKMLPDALQVFISGSYASSDTSEDSSAVCWSPASAFTLLEIPSVRISHSH